MKAAVIYNPGDVKVVELDVPTPGPGEVFIKVAACGVCGTEHTLYTGWYYANYPVVLGHEFAGVVVEVGEQVKKFKPGDRVAVDPNQVCYKCDVCRMGSEHLCEDLKTLGITHNGGDAEYTVAAEENVYTLPDNMSLEEGVFVEPLACALRAFEVANVQLGHTVLVMGAGSMGNPTFEFFNKWSAELDPPAAGGGFSIFHDGLDSSDTGRFPEATYGTATKGNTSRYVAICATNAMDGARMDDPAL